MTPLFKVCLHLCKSFNTMQIFTPLKTKVGINVSFKQYEKNTYFIEAQCLTFSNGDKFLLFYNQVNQKRCVSFKIAKFLQNKCTNSKSQKIFAFFLLKNHDKKILVCRIKFKLNLLSIQVLYIVGAGLVKWQQESI